MTISIGTTATTAVVERELTAYQRNLVDTCFEEGNYDAAISLIDKLRHPIYKPHAPHIRNLVYIALYPPQAGDDESDFANSRMDSINASPSKISAKNYKASYAIRPEHSAAAQRVLKAFAQTNTPGSLCRALPSYNSSATENASSSEFGDSEISTRSRRIAEARNCWEILREGFLQPESSIAQEAFTTPRSSRRTRSTNPCSSYESDDTDVESPELIGPLSWPVFDWILMILEKDESTPTDRERVKYSPLLLSQISPSRSASGAQWDGQVLLDIVFYCLQSPSRSAFGVRLLTLLINLASTTLFELSMVLNSICTRMSSLSPEEIQAIFALLPTSMSCLQFQIALCRTHLTGESGPNTNTTQKPKAKAAPRPLPARQRQATSKEPSVAPSMASSDESPRSIARTYPVVSAAEIAQLICSTDNVAYPDSLSTVRSWQFKFQLLYTFGTLQEQLTHKDENWQRLIHSGELTKAIDKGFGCSDNFPSEQKMWAQDLKSLLAVMGWYRP